MSPRKLVAVIGDCCDLSAAAEMDEATVRLWAVHTVLGDFAVLLCGHDGSGSAGGNIQEHKDKPTEQQSKKAHHLAGFLTSAPTDLPTHVRQDKPEPPYIAKANHLSEYKAELVLTASAYKI